MVKEDKLTFSYVLQNYLHISYSEYANYYLKKLPRNIAVLLSDQNPFESTIVRYFNIDIMLPYRFHGSILKQINDCWKTLKPFSRICYVISPIRIQRFDLPRYPKEAVKNALLYSFAHRNYRLDDGDVFNPININNKHMRFFTDGSKNNDLVKVLNKLGYKDNLDNIDNVKKSYKKYLYGNVKPASNDSQIILPNLIYGNKAYLHLDI